MKGKIRSFAALLAAVTVAASALPTTAFADDNYNAAANTGKSSSLENNNAINDAAQFGADAVENKAIFTKSLKIENEADIPNVKFSYAISSPDTTLTAGNGITADDVNKYVFKATGNSDKVSIFRGINAGNIAVKGYYFDNASTTADDEADEYDLTTGSSSVNKLTYTNAVATPTAATTPVYNGTSTFDIYYASQTVNRTTDNSTKAVTVADFKTSNYAATDDGKNVNIAHPFDNDAEQTEAGLTSAPTADASEYYLANKSILLDFNNIVFSEPGIYRYYISEAKGSESYIKYDDKNDNNDGVTDTAYSWRTLDVYVEDTDPTGATPNNKELAVTGYVLYNGKLTDGAVNTEPLTPETSTHNAGVDGVTTWQKNGAEVGGSTKSTGFLNEYLTSNLSIGKKVEGNQGAKDKYFKFTVAITGLTPSQTVVLSEDSDKTRLQQSGSAAVGTATKYTIAQITGSDASTAGTYDGNNVDADANYDGQQFKADASGNLTLSLYLRSADYATLMGLPVGASYTITEDKEDYTTVSKYDYQGNTVATVDYTGLQNMVAYVTGVADRETPANTGTEAIAATSVSANDAEFAFVNTKSGVIPTGIIMSIAPAVVVGVGVLAAIIAMVIAGKKRELEEE